MLGRLYHHKCLREVYKGNTIILHIESKQAPKCCPQCGHPHLVKNGFRTCYQPSDRWQKGNSAYESRRYKCKRADCDYDCQERIAFARAVTATLVALQSRMNPIFSLCGEASAGAALRPKF